MALDRDVEEAAASLGAGPLTIFRRIVLPLLLPAIASGAALAFARAMGEYGSVLLISGGLPTGPRSRRCSIYDQIQDDDSAGAAADRHRAAGRQRARASSLLDVLQRRVARRG